MKKFILFITVALGLTTNINAQSAWQQGSTPPSGSVWALASIGDTIISGTTFGVFFSTDKGATWAQKDTGNHMEVRALTVVGNDIYAGTGGMSGAGVYKSSDFGWTWTSVTPTSLNSSNGVSSFAVTATDIFLATQGGGGVFKSSLSGINSSSWVSFNTGLTSQDINALQIIGTIIYAATYGNGVYKSSTATDNWSATSGMIQYSNYIAALSSNGTNMYAGNISGSPVLYHSSNTGVNWSTSSTAIFANKPVYSLINNGPIVFAGTEGAGVLMSQDSGTTWQAFNNGFKDALGNWYCNQINVRSFVIKDTIMYAGTDCGVWRCSTTAPTSTTTCAAGVTTAIYKDSAQTNVWDVYPTYYPQVTSAIWYWGDGTSTTGLYPSHTYTAVGNYHICVTAYSSCGDSSSYCQNDSIYRLSGNNTVTNAIQVNVINSTTGIKKSTTTNQISIYPNPSNGNFVIETNSDNVRCIVSDVNGNEVLNQSINGTTNINAAMLNEGVYSLTIIGNNSITNKKIVIVK